MRNVACALCRYLTALEGDFWVKLRGPGLTYSYGLRNLADARALRFSLFKVRIHAFVHTYIHTYIHTHIYAPHTYACVRFTLFKACDPLSALAAARDIVVGYRHIT